MLQERFREFARDTGNIGQERVDTVNHMADELINSGHSDAATIAEWKDGLNEAWADLLELIDTRTQILAASYELHKFYHDAKEIFGRIQDKHKKLPEELGRDQNTVETLQRMHTTFEHDIQALGTQVGGRCLGRQPFFFLERVSVRLWASLATLTAHLGERPKLSPVCACRHVNTRHLFGRICQSRKFYSCHICRRCQRNVLLIKISEPDARKTFASERPSQQGRVMLAYPSRIISKIMPYYFSHPGSELCIQKGGKQDSNILIHPLFPPPLVQWLTLRLCLKVV